jgi:hypothetical protein
MEVNSTFHHHDKFPTFDLGTSRSTCQASRVYGSIGLPSVHHPSLHVYLLCHYSSLAATRVSAGYTCTAVDADTFSWSLRECAVSLSVVRKLCTTLSYALI